VTLSQAPTEPWLPAWFQPPARSELATGHHLRPLRAADAGLPDLPADVDLLDVVAAAAARAAYCYGVFDDEERAVLGVVVLRPGVAPHDVEARWAVAAGVAGSALPAVLGLTLPEWLVGCWPFRSPRVSG
jgi:hypothetical protein